jgi:F-type H+-transporting ATPase subunit delta
MASHSEAARGLARALAESLVDEDLAPMARDLGGLGQIIVETEGLRRMLANPALPSERRGAIARRLGEVLSVTDKARRFVDVLAAQEALPLLPEIAVAFAGFCDERRGAVKASVTTARRLDEGQRARLRAALGKLTGREITLEESTDPSLIGGVVARVGSTLYDGSLRSRLSGLRGRITGP